MQEWGWNFRRIKSMKISFYETGELSGSSIEKKPLSSASLNIENDDKNGFLWSLPAYFHPFEIVHNRISSFRKDFNELKIDGFDFSYDFK